MPNCELCGEPMPEGESMFKYHGYSGPCPKPPLPREHTETIILAREDYEALIRAIEASPEPTPALRALMQHVPIWEKSK